MRQNKLEEGDGKAAVADVTRVRTLNLVEKLLGAKLVGIQLDQFGNLSLFALPQNFVDLGDVVVNLGLDGDGSHFGGKKLGPDLNFILARCRGGG